MKLIVKIITVIFICSPWIANADCVQGDCINGQGTYILHDGSRYVGEFREGVRNGQGSMTYPDGTRYEGNWQNDLPNGHGVKTLTDGMLIIGEFKNGITYGSGTVILQDGSRLKVKWSNDAQRLENEDESPDMEIGSAVDEKESHETAASVNNKKLDNINPRQAVSTMEVTSEDPPAEEGISGQGLDDSPIPTEGIAPQSSKVAEVDVNGKAPEETVIESRPGQTENVKTEVAVSAEKEDGAEPEAISAQNLKTSKAVEYASITVGANIRSEASLTSEVLRTVPPGYPVVVLERQVDWLLVEDYRGRKGWVAASLVAEPETVIVKVFRGNLRSGPSLQDGIVAQLDHGTIVSTLERSGEWLKVNSLDGLTGWVYFKVIWPAEEMNAR